MEVRRRLAERRANLSLGGDKRANARQPQPRPRKRGPVISDAIILFLDEI
jgi:hypothetical protein